MIKDLVVPRLLFVHANHHDIPLKAIEQQSVLHY